jgi:hypothetical protein
LAAVLVGGNVLVRRGRHATAFLAALACALIAFGTLPGLAAAETFDVNTTGDEPNTGVGVVCDTGGPAAENCHPHGPASGLSRRPVASGSSISRTR